MRVVSDTSPLSNLAIIDRLDLLQRHHQLISIPSAVARELAALTHSQAVQRIQHALDQGWLLEDRRSLPPPPFPRSLDPGESAAIALALAVNAGLILIDEKVGRAAARSVGLEVAGILGELLYAKRVGWISLIAPELLKLRSEAGFFLDQEIENFVLSQAGEN